jgi:hypothetical protein
MPLKLKRGSDYEDLYKKMIELEKLLGIEPVDIEKCLKLCKAIASNTDIQVYRTRHSNSF